MLEFDSSKLPTSKPEEIVEDLNCIDSIIRQSKHCKYGDPFCPCNDPPDLCHYEGPNPMPKPSAKQLRDWGWDDYDIVTRFVRQGWYPYSL